MTIHKTVQFFSEEALAHGSSMTHEEIAEFLENFRLLQADRLEASSPSRLISMKVPEALLRAFKLKARSRGVRYQTQIKRLMREWLEK